MSDFHATWPVSLLGINALKSVGLLRNSKYFTCGVPECDARRTIFYCPTLEWIYLGTNENIEKALHTLLVRYIFSDMDQCFNVHANTEAGNLVKLTPAVLHLKACARLSEQKKKKKLLFSEFAIYQLHSDI